MVNEITKATVLQLRKKLRLTQNDFAYVFGFHPMTVSKYERGLCLLSVRDQYLFSRLLETQINFDVNECLTLKGGVVCFVQLIRCIET